MEKFSNILHNMLSHRILQNDPTWGKPMLSQFTYRVYIVLYVSCFEGLPPGITSGSKGQRWPLFVYASMSEFLPLLWFQKQSYKYTIKQNILLNQTKNH